MTNGVRVEHSGGVARVVLDRPPVNAISTGLYESLIEALTDLGNRDDVHVVVLESSNPKVFSAGADINELQEIVGSDTSDLDIRRQELARTTYEVLLGLAQPTIAAVGGFALGAGAVLAACCDIRVASSTTRIGLSEVNVVRAGGARHLMRILPQGVVRQMYFTSEPLSAPDLYRLGAVDRLCEPETEAETALAMAKRIASKSPIALRVAKKALNACESLAVKEGYAVEQEYTLELGRTHDAREAVAAFVEKRPPVWTGK